MICIDIVPTEVCSWECKYCVFPQIEEPKHTTKEIIDKHYRYIKEIIDKLINRFEVQLYLQGGEVGELPKDILIYLLEKFNKKFTISTNGLFLEKEYHKDPNIRQYTDKIFWHVSPDCSNPNIKDYEDEKIVRGIVHWDASIMEDFIEKSNMDIEYSEIEMPLGFKSPAPFDRILRCRRYHNDITIDFVNEKLCLCIRNFKEETIDLNEDNLRELLIKFPSDIFNLSDVYQGPCYSCSRLCINRTSNNIAKNKLLLRKLL